MWITGEKFKMATTPSSEEEIVTLLKDGYRPRIKRVKGYDYISLRRGRTEKEVSLGRYTKERWSFLQENGPKSEAELKAQLQELQRQVTESDTELWAQLRALQRQATNLISQSPDANSVKRLETRIKDLEDERANTKSNYEAMGRALTALKTTVQRIPISTLYDNFKCEGCGSQHQLMLVHIRCSKCNTDSMFGGMSKGDVQS